MIQLFKTNAPSLYIYLFLYVVVLTAIQFFHPLPYQGEVQAPLSQFLFYLIHLIPINAGYTEGVISIVLLIINAVLINSLIFRYKIFTLTCQLPGLIYLLIACSFEHWSQLSPAMLSNTVLILFLDRLLALSRQENALVSVFDLGFLVAIGSLFYFSFIVHFITLFVGIVLLRPFILREWLAGFAGLFTPYFLTGTYYYWYDSLSTFVNSFFITSFTNGLPHVAFSHSVTIWLLSPLLILLLVISLFNLQRLLLKSTIQLRKSYTIVLWAFLFTAGSTLLNTTLTFAHFSSIAVPLSFLAFHFFMTIEKNKLVETVHTILFVSIIVLQYQQFIRLNIPFL